MLCYWAPRAGFLWLDICFSWGTWKEFPKVPIRERFSCNINHLSEVNWLFHRWPKGLASHHHSYNMTDSPSMEKRNLCSLSWCLDGPWFWRMSHDFQRQKKRDNCSACLLWNTFRTWPWNSYKETQISSCRDILSRGHLYFLQPTTRLRSHQNQYQPWTPLQRMWSKPPSLLTWPQPLCLHSWGSVIR